MFGFGKKQVTGEKQTGQSFASLGWYDGLIEFVFRFVAKTSEPLLAAGLVISAADYLTKGALMHNNGALTLAWAWTSAIAIEASSGVVFVYALQSFKDNDQVKGWVYLILSLLLVLTGASMLFLQLNATTTGSAESAIPPAVSYAINVLRVVVSVAYVYLCRAKHIKFTDLKDTHEQVTTPAPVVSPDVLNVLIERLDHLTVSVTQLTAPSMPALPAPQAQRSRIIYDEQGYAHLAPLLEEPAESRASEAPPVERSEPSQMEMHVLSQFASKEQEVAAILARMPGATPEQVAQEANCNMRTAEKWMKRLQEQGRTN